MKKDFNKFYFEHLVTNIPHFVFWKDLNSTYLGCNENFAQMAGLISRKEIVGKSDFDLPWKADAEAYQQEDREVINTGIAISEKELALTKSDNSTAIILVSKVPIRDEKNKIIGVLGIYTDITDRKKQEKALIEAKEKAEQSDKLKTEFIHNIEHDIRTPLSGLWGFANMLASDEKDPEKKELINLLEKCAKEILDYHNNILDYAKTETGIIPIIEKKFSLKSLIEKIESMELPEAKYKNIKFTVSVSEKIPDFVIGDPNRVERILLNLVGNSFKFTKEGHIKIIAEVAKITNKKIIIQLTVEDTGIGISKDIQESIYEKFTRGTPSNTGLYKGAGLGLKAVKQLVQEIEGEIDLESNNGNGTRFICTLPFNLPLLDEHSAQ